MAVVLQFPRESMQEQRTPQYETIDGYHSPARALEALPRSSPGYDSRFHEQHVQLHEWIIVAEHFIILKRPRSPHQSQSQAPSTRTYGDLAFATAYSVRVRSTSSIQLLQGVAVQDYQYCFSVINRVITATLRRYTYEGVVEYSLRPIIIGFRWI